MKYLVTILVLLFSVACNNPKDILVTGSISEMPDKDINEIKKLDEEERKLFAGYALRRAFTKDDALVTVGEAIEDQREFIKKRKELLAKQKVAAAKEDEKRKLAQEAFDTAFDISALEKGYEKIDYKEYLTIRTRYINNSGKEVRAIRYALNFTDLFGDPIMNYAFTDSNPSKDGNRRDATFQFHYNDYDRKQTQFHGTDLSNMKYTAVIIQVIYADGTVYKL